MKNLNLRLLGGLLLSAPFLLSPALGQITLIEDFESFTSENQLNSGTG